MAPKKSVVHQESTHPIQKKYVTLLIGATLIMGLSGCAVGPHLSAPNVAAPKSYNAHSLFLSSSRQHIQWTRQQAKSWWSLFHSTTLTAYIQKAMKANPNLQAAHAALARQQALVLAAQGGLYPQIGANAGISRQRALRTGSNGGQSYRIPGNLYSLFLGTLDISYNPDVFGRQNDLIHAAKARKTVSLAELDQTEVFLAADVSRAVIQGAALQAQLHAAQKITTADEHLLKLLQQEYRIGDQNLQNVEQQAAQTAAARARIAPLQAAFAASRHALADLLGESPNVPLTMPKLHNLQLPAHLPATIPSALAENRPDIQAATAELKVAAAQADVATANLYPQFNITADIGKAAMTGGLFFNPFSTIWSLGAGLAAPIYNGGALHAQRRAAIDQYHVVSDQYRSTVLNAFREVADALRALQGADAAYTQQKRAQISSGKALQLAEARYRDGVTGYTDVLDAEIAYQQDTVKAIQGRSQRYLDSVALFVALGDGWQPTSGAVPHPEKTSPSTLNHSAGVPA
ncbi:MULTISPECIES: efflux transporter outer membrane subunit [Acidithiobacillus]|uniref:efflux transporter outer membrane subunit n=2 Tax=Acidithiobacillaceae TaxID=225058 RepID=UPI000980DBD7|nr:MULTISPECIES: efflux transporter outer membrane subunit [Acidithiobacillus]MBE7563672.1 efflux transporter outer membrane subunit [Acidithiobacillus sp. HP-6]MBE7569449.1 efflux transporter outer membrane subunit [Acidithiobacillus sp. HP-2]